MIATVSCIYLFSSVFLAFVRPHTFDIRTHCKHNCGKYLRVSVRLFACILVYMVRMWLLCLYLYRCRSVSHSQLYQIQNNHFAIICLARTTNKNANRHTVCAYVLARCMCVGVCVYNRHLMGFLWVFILSLAFHFHARSHSLYDTFIRCYCYDSRQPIEMHEN